MDDLVSRLQHTFLFAALDEAAREELVEGGTTRKLRKGQALYSAGDAPTEIAWILSGRLDVSRTTEDGEHVFLRSLGPNALVGVSTIAGAPHTADVHAGVPSKCHIISGRSLRRAFESRPELALQSLAYVAGLLGELTLDVEELRLPSLEERVRRRLQRLSIGRRELELTHEELADQVGATRANVSRALKKLEQAGEIRRHRGRIEVL